MHIFNSYVSLPELVGGLPTPLIHDGVRQLGWWNSHYTESHTIHVPNHQPDNQLQSIYMYIRIAGNIPEQTWNIALYIFYHILQM